MSDTTDPITRRIDLDPVGGTLAQVEGRWVLTMVRDLPHPPARVWDMITDPVKLAQWSPVVADRPLTSPGPATSREAPDEPAVDTEVLVSDAPHELVHRWQDHQVRWAIDETAAGCRLTLEQTFDVRETRASFGAGWHICLAVLEATLDGEQVSRVVGARANDYGWDELFERYSAALP